MTQTHYHDPYRGLPQEILDHIFQYCLCPPNGITIVPWADPPEWALNQEILEERASYFKFDARKVHDGRGSPLQDEYYDENFTIKFRPWTDAHGLLWLNRDQFKNTRRILCQNGVVHIPRYMSWYWTPELCRSLPPMKHLFVDISGPSQEWDDEFGPDEFGPDEFDYNGAPTECCGMYVRQI